MAVRASIIFSLTIPTYALPNDFSIVEKRLNNGVGVTPAMSWNNWNVDGSTGSNAANALAAANALVNLGLSQLGYKYICNGAATLSANFSDVPGLGAGTYAWKEAYTAASGTGSSVSTSLGNHDMAIFKVTKNSSGVGQGGSATTSNKASSSATFIASTTTSATNRGSASHWGECGGIGWTGPPVYASPYTCITSNPYYSQCL